jgi:hypothetical protein
VVVDARRAFGPARVGVAAGLRLAELGVLRSPGLLALLGLGWLLGRGPLTLFCPLTPDSTSQARILVEGLSFLRWARLSCLACVAVAAAPRVAELGFMLAGPSALLGLGVAAGLRWGSPEWLRRVVGWLLFR